jgi:SAM-dependent methyltransferase
MSTASEANTQEGSETKEASGRLGAGDLGGHEVVSVWDLCLAAEYDRAELLSGLAAWLGPPDGSRVLDCACGTGFPALELHKLGYDMSCTDGSAFMLERFRRNAHAAGTALEPTQVRWEQLGALYPAMFDIVMCRGCSLIYAGTWDSEAEPDWSVFVASVENFVRCLRPGGRLYIDTTHEEELHGEYPQVEEHAPRMIDGHRVEWCEHITADPQVRVRRWQVSLRVDDTHTSFERRSHFVPHADFVKVLEDAGLEDVCRVEVRGERYAVFVGRRPAA